METTIRINDINHLFTNTFIESKAYYMHLFNMTPSITWIDNVNTEKLLGYTKEEYASAIIGIFQYSKYNWSSKKITYDTTIIVLNDSWIIELGGSYCEILHPHHDYDTANKLVREFVRFKRKEKKKDFEINLISKDSYGLELKTMDIKKTTLDLQLYYEDDFLPVDKLIMLLPAIRLFMQKLQVSSAGNRLQS